MVSVLDRRADAAPASAGVAAGHRGRRLRIAHVTATFPPYLGGTGNVVLHNALELARRGHDVHVFTSTYPLGDHRDPAKIRVHRLEAPLRIGNAPLTPELPRALRRFDLVHLHWPFMFGAELTWLACRRFGIPYVVTYHVKLVGNGLRAPLFTAYDRLWGPRILPAARAILAVTADHFRAHVPYPVREVVEIPNGVDVEAFRPEAPGGLPPEDVGTAAARERHGLPPGVPLALFVGALDRAHHYRRLDVLLEALHWLPQAHLAVVGDGDMAATYRRQTRDLGLQGRVHFLGRIGPDRLPAIYRLADVVVLPSSIQESFGMVLAEAMACGKPVIASRLPGVRTVVADGTTGLLVPPADPAALAGALTRLLGDAPLRAEMGAAGRRRVLARYDWRRIGERLEAVYLGALDATRPVTPPAGRPGGQR